MFLIINKIRFKRQPLYPRIRIIYQVHFLLDPLFTRRIKYIFEFPLKPPLLQEPLNTQTNTNKTQETNTKFKNEQKKT